MWLVWLAIALLATLAEVASLNFVLLMFAGGALAAALADALGAPLPIEVVVFGVVSVGLLFVGRPPLVAWSDRTAHHATGVAALVGQTAEVLAEVDPRGGQVKLAGEVWSARAEGPGSLLPPGTRVTVLRIDGATAVVAAEPPQIGTSAQEPDAPAT
jgi:membrane protein implicated in regulation of membrane protease activity